MRSQILTCQIQNGAVEVPCRLGRDLRASRPRASMKLLSLLALCIHTSTALLVGPALGVARAVTSRAAVRLQNEMEPEEGWYVRTLRLRLLAAWLTCFQSHTRICARLYIAVPLAASLCAMFNRSLCIHHTAVPLAASRCAMFNRALCTRLSLAGTSTT